MNKIPFFSAAIFGCFFCTTYSLFEHGRAICAAQSGDWKRSQQLMNDVVVHAPEDPQVIYDAGVVAYRNKEFVQAQAYFSKVNRLPNASKQVQEQAHFNAGNSFVELKKLGDAVESYEKVLKINSHNERAKHNLRIVKKMIEDQKRQDEQQKNKNEQKKKEQQNDDKHDDKQKKKDASESRSDEKNKQSQDKQSQDNKQSAKQDSADAKERKNNEQKNEQQGIDAWLAQVLEESEQQDVEKNKAMIRATVGKQLAGHDGQNCW
jgi:cobalamin biosynthesis protein CobT